MLERYQLWLAWLLAICISVSGSIFITAQSQLSLIRPFTNNNQLPGTAQAAVAKPEPVRVIPAPPNTPPGKLADGVPILMYHSISEADNKLCVSPADFAAQLNYIAQAGYHTITVRELLAAINGTASLPPKPLVITLDDGYRDNYTVAYPMLKERGMVATIYTITQKVGTANGITANELREMISYGIEIGSHTQHHLDLRYLNEADLTVEIIESRQVLSAMIQSPVDSFCYPSGRYTLSAVQKVKDAGYGAAVTTHSGILNDPSQIWLMPRIRVSGGESLEIFIANLPQNI